MTLAVIKLTNCPWTERIVPSVLSLFWVRLCKSLWLGGVINGQHVGLVIVRSLVRLPAIPLPSNNSGQVVHAYVPLSPSSMIWYRPNCWEGNGSLWAWPI